MIKIICLLFLFVSLAQSNPVNRVRIFQTLYADDIPETVKIPEVFKDYIQNMDSSAAYIPLKPINYELPVPDFITRKEALKEIEIIQYLFDYGYSGTNYWNKNGVDFAALFADMRKTISESTDNNIAVIELEKMLDSGLQGILDGHFSFSGKKRHRFYKHKSPYFADLLIKKEDNHWIVLDSAVEGIKNGDFYLDDKSLLYPTLAPDNSQHFLLGTLSYKPITAMKLLFSSGRHNIYFHTGRCGNASTNEIYLNEKIAGIDVLSVSTFNGQFHEQLNQYSEAGKSLRDTEHFILNIMGNGGGGSSFSEKFVQNINNIAHWRSNFAMIMSPPVIEAWSYEDENEVPHLAEAIKEMRKELEKQKLNPTKSWTCYPDKPQQTGNYKGKAIVLANRRVASSGEATLAYFKSFQNGLIIGENSAGIGQFGEIISYQMPHSHIIFNIPSKLFLMEDSPESRGFIPDFWLDHENPVAIVTDWLNNSENFQMPLTRLSLPGKYDFENKELPKELKKEVGVTRPGKTNIIKVDCSEGFNSNCSMLFEAEADTRRIFSLNAPIPPQKRQIKLTAMVKGENLRPENDQFDNCYIGFTLNSKGENLWETAGFRENFDWKKMEINLKLEPDDSNVVFRTMCSIAGKFWIDDLQFSYPE